jgi:hypothetical protein
MFYDNAQDRCYASAVIFHFLSVVSFQAELHSNPAKAGTDGAESDAKMPS